MRLNAIELGNGAPVVLLHGLFGAAQNFGAVQRRLAARWRVIALDLRNHGNSPHAPAMDYATMAEDVRATLASMSAVPAAVVGHSMGGKTAMAMALAHPEAVARLCVVDIAPVPHPPALRHYVAALRAIPLRPGLLRRDADAALASVIPEPAIRGFLLQNLRLDQDPPAWRLALPEIEAAMPAIEAFPDTAQRYEGPALFLRGERSDYVRPEHHARIAALFPAARIDTVPRVGHWVHSENPEGFLAALDPFLDGDRAALT